MAGKITDLFVNIGAKTDDFKKGVKDVTSESKDLSVDFSKMGAVIAGAFAASTVISFGKECMQLASIAEGVEIAFKRIGNEATLEGLRRATKGTVADLDLMKAAVQANNFGIPLSQLGKLLEFAHQRAKDTGQSVDYLVQSIVMGIGRKSPLILDNLGISAVQLKEKLGSIGTETASVGDIAKVVGDIAADSMSKIGNSVETAAEKTAKLEAAWANFKTEVGKVINSAINPLKDILITLFDATKEMWQGQVIKESNQIMMDFFKNTGYEALSASDKLKTLNNTIDAQKYLLTDQKDRMEVLKKTYEGLHVWEFGRKKTIEQQSISLGNHLRANQEFIKQLELLKTKIADTTDPNMVPGVGDPVKTLGLLDAAKAKVEELQKQIGTAQTESFAAKLTNDLIKAQDELLKLQKSIRDQAAGGAPIGTGLTPMQGKTGQVSTGVSLDAQLTGKMQSFADSYTGTSEEVIAANEQMEISMSGFAMSFAEGLGGVIAGTESLGGAFVNAMSGFMAQLGQQMIAVGFAKTVLDKLLLTPGGGAIAIAAGMTLVALAGAARATMASGPGGGGASRSTSSGSYGSVGQGNLTVQIEGVTRGGDIYWSQKNYNNTLNRTISRR